MGQGENTVADIVWTNIQITPPPYCKVVGSDLTAKERFGQIIRQTGLIYDRSVVLYPVYGDGSGSEPRYLGIESRGRIGPVLHELQRYGYLQE